MLLTWICNNTGRSMLAVIAFHFMANASGEIMALEPALLSHSVFIKLVAVLVIVARYGPAALTGAGKRAPGS